MIKFTKRWYSVIRSPHSILGLKQDATQPEVKNAYKKLVMKYHPDINKTDENAAEKFKEVTEAYGVLKKHFEKIENSAIPQEEGFVSKRPKYDGKVSSVLRDDKVREYINFRPLDIEVPIKEDRLGVTYKPFFTDQDATHPKLGTMAIILYSFIVSGVASTLLWNSKRRDEMVQQALFDKLMRKYEGVELDRNELHPALQVMKEDPEYQEYIKGVSEKELYNKFLAFTKAPNIIEKVSLSAEDKKQKIVSFEKFKVI